MWAHKVTARGIQKQQAAIVGFTRLQLVAYRNIQSSSLSIYLSISQAEQHNPEGEAGNHRHHAHHAKQQSTVSNLSIEYQQRNQQRRLPKQCCLCCLRLELCRLWGYSNTYPSKDRVACFCSCLLKKIRRLSFLEFSYCSWI